MKLIAIFFLKNILLVQAIDTVTVYCDGFSPWGSEDVSCSVNTSPTSFSASSQAWYDSSLVNSSGWWVLDVTSSANDDSASALRSAAYAAGVAEGILSCNEITQFKYNVLTSSFGRGPNAGPNDEILAFINDNDAWVASQIAALGEDDDYWLAISQITATMDGILEGYNQHSACAQEEGFVAMTALEINLVNLDGDLFDLMTAYPDHSSQSNKRLKNGLRHQDPSTSKELRCSSLFKLTDNDVFFGHDTWDTYATAAPRIFKHNNLPVRRNGDIVPYLNSFSSSPGFVASIDDYYLISGSSRLTVIETSNEVYNTSVYSLLSPETNMCWVRSMVANMLATNGSDWSNLFGRFHSGTYNNQWMVLDMNKFVAGSADMSDLFWVLEEAPGLIHAEDMTDTLVQDGYWASYNVAYFEDIRAQMGETQSYTECPRANLFREMEGSVVDAASMKTVMGWNDYENDPYSLGKPSNAIMARDDLMGFAAGGIDAKCSSLMTSRTSEDGEVDSLVTHTRAGPTHDSLPPFCWDGKEALDATPHRGHPNCFDFEWGDVQPMQN
jgi:hypothetical protein